MKKNRLFLMAGALCAALGLGSCSNEMEEVAVPAEGATRTVTLTVSLPGGGADTRTAYAVDGTGLKVTWAEGDKLTAVSGEYSKSTTFTLTSGAGTDTATFTGEIPEGVSEGSFVSFYYPAMTQIDIDDVTHYIWPDYSTQDGTLAGLSKVDAFEFDAEYSGGELNVISDYTYRYTSFLHFAAGTAVASAGDTPTFTISGAPTGYDYTASGYIYGDIIVSNFVVNSDGTLANDVYIAFASGKGATLTITVGSEEKVYLLDKNFTLGRMYNIKNLSQLTPEPTADKIVDLSTLTEDYTAQDGEMLKGKLGTAVKISIAEGATVKLYNVDINSDNALNGNYGYAAITCEGDATIILFGKNSVNKFWAYPSIQVGPEGTTLTIQGNGDLIAGGTSFDHDGAIIGSAYKGSCGNIVIKGGTIIANGYFAAGIGSGYGGSCGDITISGGSVRARGGYSDGAAIGSAGGGSCGNITISGGSVSAAGTYGGGIGIGGNCKDITITTGVTQVRAEKDSSYGKFSIGGGSSVSGTITIGGTVYWDGTAYQNDGETYLSTSPLIYKP